MSSVKGMIVLMGSGELTATMVEVHKRILARFSDSPTAVFLDTPAGFQLNVDEISRKAVEYFRVHVQKQLNVVSYKSSEDTSAFEAETAFHMLRNADYVLVGPGSPSYAVRQIQNGGISIPSPADVFDNPNPPAAIPANRSDPRARPDAPAGRREKPLHHVHRPACCGR